MSGWQSGAMQKVTPLICPTTVAKLRAIMKMDQLCKLHFLGTLQHNVMFYVWERGCSALCVFVVAQVGALSKRTSTWPGRYSPTNW